MRARDDDTGDAVPLPPGVEPAKAECPKGHVLEGYMMKGSDALRGDDHYFACCVCGEENASPCIYISKRHGVEVRPVDAGELLAYYLSMRSHINRQKGAQQMLAFLQFKHDMLHFDEHAKWLCLENGLLTRDEPQEN